MKINFKPSLFFLSLVAVFITTGTVFAQGQRNDTLYFCREYKDGAEIGNSTEFHIPEKGGMITVMLRTLKPVGAVEVFILLEKDVAGVRDKISKEPFDVEAEWDYIFFSDIFFPEAGKYKISALTISGDVIAAGYVKMLKK